MVGERSVYDPRPAKADPVGTTKRITADTGEVEVWKIVAVEDSEQVKHVHRNRIAIIEKDLETIEDFDEEAVAKAAIFEERKTRAFMKADMEKQRDRLKQMVGD